jgi:hypothetical protein
MGTTNSNGSYSTSLNLNDYNIAQYSSVAVMVNNQSSVDTSWSYVASTVNSNSLSLSQSSIVVNVGQSNTISTTYSGSNALYLSSNTNPQVANVTLNGNQISVAGLSVGQTTANICVINSSLANNCANLYIITQNSANQTLSFSQSNTSIISGQNTAVNISGGNGFYQVQNNSNPSVISTNLNGPVLTLYANGSTGTSTITVCTTDLNSCGVVNASIGIYTSYGTGLTFSQSHPSITTGQTNVINISGGYGTYYISSNTNSTIVQTYISTSTVTLYGNNPGTASITICAPSGSCGVIDVTVVATSGGTINLSQKTLNPLVGQVTSVVITGGRIPYSIIQNNDGVAQYSLNSNTLTVTGVRAGSSSVDVCSASGGCVNLAVTVSSTGTTVSGVQPAFSQNNVSVNTNQTTSVYLTGNGGYYVSNNSNSNLISASISGSTLVVTGVSVGSANVTVCQTGGQCNTVYITVSNSGVTTTSSPITFNKSSISLTAGENSAVTIYGGSGSAYYVSYNSNESAIGAYISGNSLNITGKSAGSGAVCICSTTNDCAYLFVSVKAGTIISNTTTTTPTTANKYKFTKPLKFGMTSSEVRELQVRLKELGYLTATPTGYYGNQTLAAVKKYQKANGLEQLGSVGPGTRAALNIRY